jgi:hypothetical protein
MAPTHPASLAGHISVLTRNVSQDENHGVTNRKMCGAASNSEISLGARKLNAISRAIETLKVNAGAGNPRI